MEDELLRKLQCLSFGTGYPLRQKFGQRIFGPPPNWDGPPPPKGSEVFVGKIPREMFEDELVPIFSKVAKIYDMRLMMDFSGSNRGYAFVTYTSPQDAYKAIKELNNMEVRKGRHIGVVKSVDNCRLFVGNIPKEKTKQDILEEFSKRVDGVVDVILYKNAHNRKLNRGFAFVEFACHRSASMARRALMPGSTKLWGKEVSIDWAEPEPDIDEDKMKTVKVLYIRSLSVRTTVETLRYTFEKAINTRIDRVKKICDYAFVHFYEREHAELALKSLQNTEIDGSTIEIRWSKPVVRELYQIQKMTKGNAKFNNCDFTQTLMLYKQHLEKREYAKSTDEGIESCTGESTIGSPASDIQSIVHYNDYKGLYYTLAPAKLESLCKRYTWAPPAYEFRKYTQATGIEIWVAKVELPQVGFPLLNVPSAIGPLVTSICYSMEQARVQAAQTALTYLMYIHHEYVPQHIRHAVMPTMMTGVVYANPSTSIPYNGPVTSPIPIQALW